MEKMRHEYEKEPARGPAPGSARGYDPDAPWPSVRRDYLNTGRADDIKPSRIPDTDRTSIWGFTTGGPVLFTPAKPLMGSSVKDQSGALE
jgi:hypothetical protein